MEPKRRGRTDTIIEILSEELRVVIRALPEQLKDSVPEQLNTLITGEEGDTPRDAQ
jgi:hypothetical protein